MSPFRLQAQRSPFRPLPPSARFAWLGSDVSPTAVPTMESLWTVAKCTGTGSNTSNHGRLASFSGPSKVILPLFAVLHHSLRKTVVVVQGLCTAQSRRAVNARSGSPEKRCPAHGQGGVPQMLGECRDPPGSMGFPACELVAEDPSLYSLSMQTAMPRAVPGVKKWQTVPRTASVAPASCSHAPCDPLYPVHGWSA